MVALTTLGNGDGDMVNHAGGGFDTITLGNGNGDVVNNFSTVGGGTTLRNNTVTVGNGNDTIYVGNSDTIKVGTGQDSFVFQQTTPGNIARSQSLASTRTRTVSPSQTS